MKNNEKGKSPGESAVETRYLLMPRKANPCGTTFGGSDITQEKLNCLE